MAQQAVLYARELARLHQLRRRYERLLPVPLDPESPHLMEPVVREAVVLFTDLRGFTGLAERFAQEPARLLGVVNEHLATVVGAIARCGGVVEKFVGDGVMSTFGARGETNNYRQQAVAAALGIVGASEALNRRMANAWGFQLDVGVGVADGKVVLGMIGPSERAELGILGDPVNVAARLVAQAKPAEVLLAAEVYRGLEKQARAELLGPLAVRGRCGPVEVYRIALLGNNDRAGRGPLPMNREAM